jgi:hypothetical protein
MKFKDAPNTMVITTKRIITQAAAVLVVLHDEEDGMWQFLDGYEMDENAAAIISLAEMVSIDSSVEALANLPRGWIARRNDANSAWESHIQEK